MTTILGVYTNRGQLSQAQIAIRKKSAFNVDRKIKPGDILDFKTVEPLVVTTVFTTKFKFYNPVTQQPTQTLESTRSYKIPSIKLVPPTNTTYGAIEKRSSTKPAFEH